MAFSSPLHVFVCSLPLLVHTLLNVASQTLTERLPCARLRAGSCCDAADTQAHEPPLPPRQPAASWGFEFLRVSLTSPFI